MPIRPNWRRQGKPCEQICRVSGRKKALFLAEAAAVVCTGTYFFYRKAAAGILLLPVGWYWFREKGREEIGRQQQKLRWQFKELLLSVRSSLQAGYSVENAIRSARKELTGLYGKDAALVRELVRMERALQNNVPVETLLLEFGQRSGVKEIQDFAQIFAIGRRTGADLGDMIGTTVRLIGEKMETEREIRTAMSAKVMEQKVMSVVPFGMMAYVGITSQGFFSLLYHNVPGALFMSLCLAAYLGAVWMAKRIVRIEW